MPFDFSAYRVAVGETPASSGKFNNFLTAVQNAVNDMPIASLHGYPSDGTKFLKGDGSWGSPATDLMARYVKTTTTTVTGTTLTDLFGGGFTIGAALLPTSGAIKVFAWGDYKSTTNTAQLRLQLKLGTGGAAQTIWDSNDSGNITLHATTVRGWYFFAIIQSTAGSGGISNAQRSGGNFILGGLGTTGTGFGVIQNDSLQAGFSGPAAGTTVAMSGSQALVLEAKHNVANVTMNCYAARVEVGS